MKKIILTAICWTILAVVLGQNANEFFEKGLEKAQAGKLEEAIELFSKSLELQPEDYYSWYYRGIAKIFLDNYEEALTDFEQTIKLAPDYKNAWLYCAITKKYLTDYEGAIADFSHAIQLDQNYADAYYNRGLIYEMLGKKDSACLEFNKSMELGLKQAQRKIDKCNDITKTTLPVNVILRLSNTAKDDKYGFTQDNPIKVGVGLDGGPANRIAYLSLLRDAQGKPIKYERRGSCCHYESKSEYAMFGMAMLDMYEITYLNEKGIENKTIIYISYYDYEEPKILFGFKTVGQK